LQAGSRKNRSGDRHETRGSVAAPVGVEGILIKIYLQEEKKCA